MDGDRAARMRAPLLLPARRERYPVAAPTKGSATAHNKYGIKGTPACFQGASEGWMIFCRIISEPVEPPRLTMMGIQNCRTRRFIISSSEREIGKLTATCKIFGRMRNILRCRQL